MSLFSTSIPIPPTLKAAYNSIRVPAKEENTAEFARDKAIVINGMGLVKSIHESLRKEVKKWDKRTPMIHPRPCFGYVLAGDNKQSEHLINIKKKACENIGIEHEGIYIADPTEDKVLEAIRTLERNPKVSGITVQLPLPDTINVEKVMKEISHKKDIDGLHPLNIGDLIIKNREPLFMPPAAKACVYIIQRHIPSVIGKRVIIIGNSEIVGAPTAQCLRNMDATVTVCPSVECSRLPDISREADILVVNAGIPRLVDRHWIKKGAMVIDTGYHKVWGKKRKVIGDVNFEDVLTTAGYITPVPGCVGPMTIAMLMENVIEAWKTANFGSLFR